jgi:hypothetical protein
MLISWVREGLPSRGVTLDGIMGKIDKMRWRPAKTAWSGYHDDLEGNAKRFDRILDVINDLEGELASAVDLGGNQGGFARLVVQRTRVKRVACVDLDEAAVDEGYNHEKAEPTGKLTFAHCDFMKGWTKPCLLPAQERLRADLAIALAVTHHLILSQKYAIDDVLRGIGAYARRYVLIEFMPLGIWSEGHEVHIPDWYTRDWFRRSFASVFDPVLEQQLTKSRILFVGMPKVPLL